MKPSLLSEATRRTPPRLYWRWTGNLIRKWSPGVILLVGILTGCQLNQRNNWPDPVPENWLIHNDPAIGYSLRFPPGSRLINRADSTSPPHRLSSLIIVPDVPDKHYVIKIHSLRNSQRLALKDFILTPQAQTFNNMYFGKWPVKNIEAYDEFIKPVEVAGGYPAYRVDQNEETHPLAANCKHLTYIGHEELVILSMVCVDGRSNFSGEPNPRLVELYTQISSTIRFD